MGSIDKACISGFLCRLCSEMHRTVIHIYGDQGLNRRLLEKINGYLPVTITPTDPLPKTICETCMRRVEEHYDLLMRIRRRQDLIKLEQSMNSVVHVEDIAIAATTSSTTTSTATNTTDGTIDGPEDAL